MGSALAMGIQHKHRSLNHWKGHHLLRARARKRRLSIRVIARLAFKGGGTLLPINPKLAQLKGSALPPVVSCELGSWHLFIASCGAVMQSALLNLTWPVLQLLSCMLMFDRSSMRTLALFHQKAERSAAMAGYVVPSKAEQYSLRCWEAFEIWNFTCPASSQIRDSLGAGGAPPVIIGNSDSGELLDWGRVMTIEGFEVRDGVVSLVIVSVRLE